MAWHGTMQCRTKNRLRVCMNCCGILWSYSVPYSVIQQGTEFSEESIYVLHVLRTFGADCCLLSLFLARRQIIDHFVGPVGLRSVSAHGCHCYWSVLSLGERAYRVCLKRKQLPSQLFVAGNDFRVRLFIVRSCESGVKKKSCEVWTAVY